MNAQIFWDYSGSYDEMRMYEEAYGRIDTGSLSEADLVAFQAQQTEFFERKAALEAEGAFVKVDYALNASLAYKFMLNGVLLETSVFGDNILGSKKRYYVSTGSSGYLPIRLKFMKEPQVLGLRVGADF